MRHHLRYTFLFFALSCMIVTTMRPAQPQVQEIATKDDFQLLIAHNPKAVMQFYNPKCPICKSFHESGAYQRMAINNPDIASGQVSIDTLPDLHQQYDIRGFPTFVIFGNGNEITRFSGKYTYRAFEKRVKNSFKGLQARKS